MRTQQNLPPPPRPTWLHTPLGQSGPPGDPGLLHPSYESNEAVAAPSGHRRPALRRFLAPHRLCPHHETSPSSMNRTSRVSFSPLFGSLTSSKGVHHCCHSWRAFLHRYRPPPYSSRPYKRVTNPSALPAPQLLLLLPSLSPERRTTGHHHFKLSAVTKFHSLVAPHPNDRRVSSPDLPSHSPCSRTELLRSRAAEGHAPVKLCATHGIAPR
jgi:hypothetical protein